MFSHTVAICYTPLGTAETASLPPCSTFQSAAAPPAQDGQATPPVLLPSVTSTHCAMVHVQESLIRGLVPSCGLPVTATFQSFRMQEDANGVLAPAADAEPDCDAHCALPLDVADLLVGDTVVHRDFDRAALPGAPVSLLSVSVEAACLHFAPPDPANPIPPEEAAAAAAAAAPATPLLPPGLKQRLLPLVLRFDSAEDLPDTPAAAEALSEQCFQPRLRFKLPLQAEWTELPSSNGDGCWRPATSTADESDPALRKRDLKFGVFALLAADVDLPAFLDECTRSSLVVEVRDRDARPAQLVLAMPADDPPAAAEPTADAAEVTKKGKVQRRLFAS